MNYLLSIICLSSLLITGCTNNANALPIKEVQEKFIQDERAYTEFLYFGKLHCLSNHFHNTISADKGELFRYQYNVSFNQLQGMARLFQSERLEQTFDDFEKDKFTAPSGDMVAFCHTLYEDHGKPLYESFIKNSQNYIATQYKKGDENYTYHQSDMIDYLQYGQIDARRYSESCQTYDCK